MNSRLARGLRRIILGGLLLTGVSCGTTPEQKTPEPTSKEPQKYDLRIMPRPGMPVLSKIQARVQIDGVLSFGGQTQEMHSVSEFDLQLVDVCSAIDEETKTRSSSRYYLQDHRLEEGKVGDTCLNGITINYSESGGEVGFEIAEGRLTKKEQHPQLLAEGPGVGPRISLPDEVEVGEEFDVDLSALLLTMIQPETGAQFEMERSRFRLEEVDRASNTAVLLGEVQWTESFADDNFELKKSFSAKLVEIRIDLEGHGLRSIELEAEVVADGKPTGDQPGGVEGKGILTTRLATEGGEGADRAWKSKPVYREVIRDFRGISGVRFTLPSYWVETTNDPARGLVAYVRTLPSGQPQIHAMRTQVNNVGIDELIQEFEGVLKSQGFDPVFEKISSPISDGFSVEFVEGDYAVRTEFYRLGETQGVFFKHLAPKDAPSEGRAEFEKARGSLSRVGS